MISAWWLLLITAISGGTGLLFGALLAEKGHQDDCANCQYNCKICPCKEKETK